MLKISDVLGWYGMGAILLAYILVSFSLITPASVWYQLLNGTGAIGIVIISFQKKAYQPGVLNIIWTLVAVILLVQRLFHSSI